MLMIPMIVVVVVILVIMVIMFGKLLAIQQLLGVGRRRHVVFPRQASF